MSPWMQIALADRPCFSLGVFSSSYSLYDSHSAQWTTAEGPIQSAHRVEFDVRTVYLPISIRRRVRRAGEGKGVSTIRFPPSPLQCARG